MIRIAALVTFLVNSVFAQETTLPIHVETLPPSKTVITSYESFQITYSIRFRDLSKSGREIIILEDRTQPSNMSFAPFEVDDKYEIAKSNMGNINVWNVTYTLRRIAESKGTDTIPSVNFFWTVRTFGEGLQNNEIRSVSSNEALISYVSTIPQSQNQVRERNMVDFGKFNTKAYVYWFASILLVVVTLYLLVRAFVSKNNNRTDIESETLEDSSEAYNLIRLSVGEARRLFKKSLKQFQIPRLNTLYLTDKALFEVFKEQVAPRARDVLLAECRYLGWGSTPREMRDMVIEKDDGIRRTLLLELVDLLEVFTSSDSLIRQDHFAQWLHDYSNKMQTTVNDLRWTRNWFARSLWGMVYPNKA